MTSPDRAQAIDRALGWLEDGALDDRAKVARALLVLRPWRSPPSTTDDEPAPAVRADAHRAR